MMIRQLENANSRLAVIYLSEGSCSQRRSETRQMDNKTKGAITRVQNGACGPQSGRMGKNVSKHIKQGFKRAKQQLVAKWDTGEKRLVRG